MIACDRCGRPAKKRVFHENAFWCHPCYESRNPTNSTSAVHGDEIPGGLTLENYGPKPITFYSHSERERYAAAHGLQLKEKFSPFPGTDKDPAGVMNSALYQDPQTMANAKALLERRFKVGVPYGGTPEVTPISDDTMVNVRTETWEGETVKDIMEKIHEAG